MSAFAKRTGLLFPLLLAGCTSSLDTNGGRRPGGGQVAPGATTETPGSPGTPSASPLTPPGGMTSAVVTPPVVIGPPPVVPMTCTAPFDPGFTPLRRMSRGEYDNTVRDLLGDTTAPARAFPNDDSVIAANLTLPQLLFEKYFDAAKTLATDAWARQVAGTQTVSLWPCTPSATDLTCARQIVSSFATRAFRRPVPESDLAPYFAILSKAETLGDSLEVGTKQALRAVLLSPNFIYRPEFDVPETPDAIHQLNPFEIASRLSYFLWASMPDAGLFDLATQGTLSNPEVLRAQANRMLTDPRSVGFVEKFGAYWLGISGIENANPDPAIYPTWSEELRASMAAETRTFLGAFVHEPHPLRSSLDANFTFLDQRLSDHYGISLSGGTADPSGLTRVPLPQGVRMGLLGHASLLTMNSKATETAPVRRGKWVLGNLLCSAPPPPPPNIDTTEAPPMPGSGPQTARERLAIHRADPACAGCHAAMDPVGLGLENFDGLGRYRSVDSNNIPIDPSGMLPTGEAFTTFEELRSILKSDPRITTCAASSVLTYALARSTTESDSCLTTDLATKADTANSSLSDLLLGVIESPWFTFRRGEKLP
ncbi:MAG: DUF1592 domain-containing protein [Polyangiaceae bacterium]|nr:DUF1592 domain-containing protein [Polyangiaceae bacterium]